MILSKEWMEPLANMQARTSWVWFFSPELGHFIFNPRQWNCITRKSHSLFTNFLKKIGKIWIYRGITKILRSSHLAFIKLLRSGKNIYAPCRFFVYREDSQRARITSNSFFNFHICQYVLCILKIIIG